MLDDPSSMIVFRLFGLWHLMLVSNSQSQDVWPVLWYSEVHRRQRNFLREQAAQLFLVIRGAPLLLPPPPGGAFFQNALEDPSTHQLQGLSCQIGNDQFDIFDTALLSVQSEIGDFTFYWSWNLQSPYCTHHDDSRYVILFTSDRIKIQLSHVGSHQERSKWWLTVQLETWWHSRSPAKVNVLQIVIESLIWFFVVFVVVAWFKHF